MDSTYVGPNDPLSIGFVINYIGAGPCRRAPDLAMFSHRKRVNLCIHDCTCNVGHF